MSSLISSPRWTSESADRVIPQSRPAVAWMAAAFLAVWAISLSRSLFDPIGFDQALYQYFAERVLVGDRMYVDIWDQNGPGIVFVHVLSTKLVGTSPLALRVFDGLWQGATLAMLALLGARLARTWSAGLLAATVYAVAYYSGGYVHNAQREAFTVLPLVGACLLAWPSIMAEFTTHPVTSKPRLMPWRCALAGFLCVFVVAIKPPLGLSFGVLWLMLLGLAWRHRSQGVAAGMPLLGLTLGFLAGMGAAAWWMMHLGWWHGFVESVILRENVPNYIRGPRLIRELAAWLPAAVIGMGIGAAVLHRCRAEAHDRWRSFFCERNVRVFTAGVLSVLLLVSLHRWGDWFQFFIRFAGIILPAGWIIFMISWRRRNRAWWLMVGMMTACLLSMILQGRFFLYHGFPLLAFASILVAHGVVASIRKFHPSPAAELLPVLAAAGLVHLIVATWGWMMTIYTTEPYVLAARSLEEHHVRVTKHKPRYPIWSDTVDAAAWVRANTSVDEPIACLINEPRLYYLSRRPAASPLVVPVLSFQPMFDEFVMTLATDRTRVLLARTPKCVPEDMDDEEIIDTIFKEAETLFGPGVESLRGSYALSARFGEICVLSYTGPADEAG